MSKKIEKIKIPPHTRMCYERGLIERIQELVMMDKINELVDAFNSLKEKE